MWPLCFALVIVDVLAHDHDAFIIKTKKGKSYLVESRNPSYLGDSGKQKAENGNDYALG